MRITAFFFVSLIGGLTATADGVTVSPILIEASPQGGATSFSIGSNSDEALTMQVRIFDWRQENGEDVYSPAEEVRFSPEIFSLAPGAKQTVRLLVPDTAGTGTWRVFVDELPDNVEAPQAPGLGLKMRLRYVIPMFAASAMTQPDLTFDYIAQDGAGIVSVTNPTNTYARAYQLRLGGDDAQASSLNPSLIYVLPNSKIKARVLDGADSYTRVTYNMGGTEFEGMIE